MADQFHHTPKTDTPNTEAVEEPTTTRRGFFEKLAALTVAGGSAFAGLSMLRAMRESDLRYNEWDRIDELHVSVNARYSNDEGTDGFLEAVAFHIRPPKDESPRYDLYLVVGDEFVSQGTVDFRDRGPGSQAEWAESSFGIGLKLDQPIDIRGKQCKVVVRCSEEQREVILGDNPDLAMNEK